MKKPEPFTSQKTDPLVQLKRLLLAEDEKRLTSMEKELTQLREKWRDKDLLIEELNPVLTGLLENKIEESREEMAEALAPVIGEAIRKQVEDQKEDVVDALYPIIGQMISKAVAASLKKLIVSVNETLNSKLSLRASFKRIKARIFGIDMGEMIISEAIPFELRELLLIAKNSGLLIAYASIDETAKVDLKDARIIAGMLTAIKSFVQDAFYQNKSGELQEIENSDQVIRIDSGRYTYLAGVYRGIAPIEFDETLKRIHNRIHHRFFKILRNYQGDNAPLHKIESIMHDGLLALSAGR